MRYFKVTNLSETEIRFADQDHIHLFYGCGVWIQEVFPRLGPRVSLDDMEGCKALGLRHPTMRAYDAAKIGRVDMLEWNWEFHALDKFEMDDICRIAARSGHIPILQFCLQKGFDFLVAIPRFVESVRNVHVLEWLWHRVPMESRPALCTASAKTGNIPVLDFCSEKGVDVRSIPAGRFAQVCDAGVLEWLWNKGLDFERLCSVAIAFGNISVLEFSKKKGVDLNTPQIVRAVWNSNIREVMTWYTEGQE